MKLEGHGLWGARLHWLAAALLLLATSCASVDTPVGEQRVLLVGNSVIYTNNLPAVLTRINDAAPNSPPYRFDMVARGGATLTEFAKDPNVAHLLKSGRYDVVVFQERGGDDFCVLQPEDRESAECQALIESHVSLAHAAREGGARVLYLGTYQLLPGASRALVGAERTLAELMGATYVEVSQRMQALRTSAPDLPWLHTDNGHPGIATTALMGVLIHRALESGVHVPPNLCTGAEMYSPAWQHEGLAHHSDLATDVKPVRCLLDAAQMAVIASGAVYGSPAVEGQ